MARLHEHRFFAWVCIVGSICSIFGVGIFSFVHKSAKRQQAAPAAVNILLGDPILTRLDGLVERTDELINIALRAYADGSLGQQPLKSQVDQFVRDARAAIKEVSELNLSGEERARLNSLDQMIGALASLNSLSRAPTQPGPADVPIGTSSPVPVASDVGTESATNPQEARITFVGALVNENSLPAKPAPQPAPPVSEGTPPKSADSTPLPLSPCDLNQDGKVDKLDIDIEINRVLEGATDEGGLKIDITHVQRVINASLGLGCSISPAPSL